MSITAYSSQLSREIFAEFKNKGWNLYYTWDGLDTARTVKKGPASRLKTASKYLVFPDCDNPKNPELVEQASKIHTSPYLAFSRDLPVIQRRPNLLITKNLRAGEKIYFNSFTTKPYHVILHNDWETLLDYEGFIEGLDFLPNLKIQLT